MDLELGSIRTRVAAADLRPPMEVLARRAQSPSKMDCLRSRPRKMQGLLPFALCAIGPVNRVNDSIRSIDPNEAMKVNGDGATTAIVAGGGPQAHFCNVTVLRRIAGLRKRENQTAAENQQGYESPSCT